MRKFYILLATVLFTGYVFAQSTNKLGKHSPVSVIKKTDTENQLMKNRILKNRFNQKNGTELHNRWYNYGVEANNIAFPSGGNLLNMGLLFPDTTVKIQYSDGLGTPWLHSMAVVLDPTSDIFQSGTLYNFQPGDSVRVDSLELLCYYRRHIQDPDVVDTLIVEVLQRLGWYNYFSGMEDDYNTDTLFFGAINYDANLNYEDPDPIQWTTNVVRFKVPLTAQTEADTTANGLNVIYFPVPGNKFTRLGLGVAATIRFKPGYDWIPNQSIINTELNEFNFLSYEENGDNTYPAYLSKEDYNSSQIVPAWAYFDQTSGWYGTYIPSWAFVQAYAYENHYVSFNISIKHNTTGITENTAKTVKLNQNIPNPADNSTSISYELKSSKNVNFVITDLTGNKVMEINQGLQSAGKHNLNLDLSSLSAGMYYYTLNTEDTKLTRKMIVK